MCPHKTTKCSQRFKTQAWIFDLMREEVSLTRCCVVLVYCPSFQLWTVKLSSTTLQLVFSSLCWTNHLWCSIQCFVVSSFLVFLTSLPSPPSSGSPAELCQLCVDDEIVAVNGVPVAHMNYNQWKDKMTSSLKAGGLTMDIRRYGDKGEIANQIRKTCNILYHLKCSGIL